MVWSQPHNIPLNRSPPSQNTKSKTEAESTPVVPKNPKNPSAHRKQMDSKYTVVQTSRRAVECYRGKRTQPKRLDGTSMRDPSLNLPQRGEIDNRLRINQPHWHSQAPPE
jgi:hypothetical protein